MNYIPFLWCIKDDVVSYLPPSLKDVGGFALPYCSRTYYTESNLGVVFQTMRKSEVRLQALLKLQKAI